MNRISFYSVDGIEFESKIQAALFSSKVKKPMTWNFNKEFFATYDWTKEPELSLDQLYDIRAKNLREKYDYLILSYSGGADSHNILMAFIRQNLHIDEIVVNHMTTAWDKFVVLDPRQTASWNTGAEHQLQTIPRLKEVEHLIPKTKITILDLTNNLFSAFTSYGDASWVMDRKEGLNPLNVTRYNYAYFTDVRKQFDKAHKVAMVVGIDKPRTVIKDDKFYLYFVDKAVNIVPIDDNFKEYTNSSLEFFYWSTDAVDILCKQAHVVKRFIEGNPQHMSVWQRSGMSPNAWRLVQEPMIKPVIYSTWDQNWFQTDKSVSDWSSEFDSWFINGYKDHPSHAVWKAGIDHMIANAPEHIKYKADGTPDGLKGYFQHYFIGPVCRPLIL
jgi:hypothetical protein